MLSKRTKYYGLLAVWIVSLLVISSMIGFFTNSTVDTWYTTLNRSPLTPPNYVFGIVWNILYAMIATSGWLIWTSKDFPQLQFIKKLYVSQLLLNWSWTPLFFGYQWVGVALVCLAIIVILVAMLIIKAYKKLTVAALLLLPYWRWLLFAGYLNFYIWQNN